MHHALGKNRHIAAFARDLRWPHGREHLTLRNLPADQAEPFLGSRYKHGLGSSTAALSSPLASAGLDGTTTFKPGTCVRTPSIDCE
jgi:hypothetical protein